MESNFAVTENKRERAKDQPTLVQMCRERWELKNRSAALETAIHATEDTAHDLRASLNQADARQRDLLKHLARIVDDCDDLLAENIRLADADDVEAAVRDAVKWIRRVERIRKNLMTQLSRYGVTVRYPVGTPDPVWDTVHGEMETDGIEPGGIVRVLRPGLFWNGAALRPSLVVIAVPIEPQSDAPESADTATPVQTGEHKESPDPRHGAGTLGIASAWHSAAS